MLHKSVVRGTSVTCPGCSRITGADDRFCGSCGTALVVQDHKRDFLWKIAFVAYTLVLFTLIIELMCLITNYPFVYNYSFDR
jgi:hypothetical protein